MAEEAKPKKVWKTAKGDTVYWTTTQPKKTGSKKKLEGIQQMLDDGDINTELAEELRAKATSVEGAEEVDGLEALKDMGNFIKRWKTLVTSTDDARSFLATRLLMQGKDPKDVKDAARVTWRTIETWCYYPTPVRYDKTENGHTKGEIKTEGKLKPEFPNSLHRKIRTAIEADKSSNTSQEE